MTSKTRNSSRQRVQSAEVGGEILKALARLGPAVSLSRLSDALGLVPAKAHRYLQSLMASGLAAQDPGTGHYRLGPEAIAIGLAAVGHIDVVAQVSQVLPRLRDATGQSCFLAIWANRGTTVVRVIEAVGAITVVTHVGSVLPLLTSASGRVFAAYLDPAQYRRPGIDEGEELALLTAKSSSPLARDLADIREHQLSVIEGQVLPGIDAMAAPVFGIGGQIAAALTLVGPHRGFDASPDGGFARTLRDMADEASAQLGYAAPVIENPPPSARRRSSTR